jgi:hypothetical protein
VRASGLFGHVWDFRLATTYGPSPPLQTEVATQLDLGPAHHLVVTSQQLVIRGCLANLWTDLDNGVGLAADLQIVEFLAIWGQVDSVKSSVDLVAILIGSLRYLIGDSASASS